VRITGYNGNERTVSIPEYIGELPVIGISGSAFLGNKTIEKIVLPKTK
jgi:hypothetical protein